MAPIRDFWLIGFGLIYVTLETFVTISAASFASIYVTLETFVMTSAARFKRLFLFFNIGFLTTSLDGMV